MGTKRELQYIYWNKIAEKIVLSKEEMNDKISTLNESLRVVGQGTKTLVSFWRQNGNWNVDKKGNYASLYVREDNKFKIYSTNTFDNTKNKENVNGAGHKAFTMAHNKFVELTNTTFAKAFGTVESEIKKCVPKQLYYINTRYVNKIIDSVSVIDYSSHYPSCGCGLLPDSHTRIELKGTVAPTEEYPFAFYLKTGHIAIYKEFDTHDWLDINNPLLGYMFSKDSTLHIREEDDVTVLMKSSKYSLKDMFTYFYNKRKEDESNKLVLNALIGMFHTKKYDRCKYAHIAAVIIARANNKMYLQCERIGFSHIIQVCVDGCIYKGTKEYGYGEGLGSLKQEFTNVSAYFRGSNQYVFSELKQYDKCIEVKHGGFDRRIDDKDLEHCDYITDINKYYRLTTKIEEML